MTSILPQILNDTISELSSLGITVKDSSISKPWLSWFGELEMHISGTYQINENLTAQVDLTVTDYGNESNAQNAFSNTELSCSPKPGLLPDDKAVMHHEGDGKAYCYTFYTDFVRSSPEKPDLTNHRANQHFKYLKQEVYGQYRISVSVSGDAWDLGNYLYYSGSYNGENIRKNITSGGVMGVLEDGSVLVSSFLTVDDSTVLNLTVDENATWPTLVTSKPFTERPSRSLPTSETQSRAG
ncbi:hypothetical protein [Thermococcus peptonophilus]|uniref:hypothetical protein n=1 Tax=Thermococcus peptonophilus TaxID=53952 RepID=UPI003465E4AA